jgi:hypothetical protein
MTKFTSVQIYKFTNSKSIITNLQFDRLQVHKFASTQNYQITEHKITKLQIEKLQDYKLHVLVCKFQIYKIINFSIYNIKKY